ncbi:recombinase family protein [Mucilaginibacter aquaedulcis]
MRLGQSELISPARKLMLSMLVAIAEMECDLLIEHTQSGLTRAKGEG